MGEESRYKTRLGGVRRGADPLTLGRCHGGEKQWAL